MIDMTPTFDSIEDFLAVTRAMTECEEWDGCVCPDCVHERPIGGSLPYEEADPTYNFNDDETDMGDRVGSM